MMKRRLWLWWVAGGLGLAALPVLWLVLTLRSGVTRANYERIREGMTLREVQSTLGGPPGNYSRFPDKEAGLWALDADRPDLNRQFFIGREVWVGNELAVAVWFDDQERVVRKEAYEMPERSFLEYLRDLFSLENRKGRQLGSGIEARSYSITIAEPAAAPDRAASLVSGTS